MRQITCTKLKSTSVKGVEMRSAFKRLDSFNGGGYGNTFKQQLDVGSTYEEIALNLENITVAQIIRVEVILNGDPIVSIDGQHLKDLDTHWGMSPESTTLRIPFRDLSLQTDAGQVLTSLVTEPTDNLVLSVRIDGATQTQIDNNLSPGLSGYAELTASRGARVVLPRIYSENIAIGMTGENNYKTFMTGPAIRRMFFKDGGRMESLRIKRNNYEIYELTKDEQNRKMERHGLHGVSNQFVFCPIQSRFGVLDMLQTEGSKLEIMPTVSAPGDMAVVMHTLEYVANTRQSPLRALTKAS